MDNRIIFTPDTNILYNLLFSDIADDDILDTFATIKSKKGEAKEKTKTWTESALYDRPMYLMLKDLMQEGKVSMKISPIVFSEIMDSDLLDDYVRKAINTSIKEGGAVLVDSIMIRDLFMEYAGARYGSYNTYLKKIKGVTQKIVSDMQEFATIMLSDDYTEDRLILDARRSCIDRVKKNMVYTSLKRLGPDISILSLPEMVDGEANILRQDIEELSATYRIYQGKDDKPTLPTSELNDSLIAALASRCNVPMVTNDKKGLILSQEYISDCNTLFRRRTGKLATGMPIRLIRFLTEYFPEYVIEYAKAFKPNQKLNAVDKKGKRKQAVKDARAEAEKILSKPGQKKFDGAIEKQFKGMGGGDLVDTPIDEFFAKDYDRDTYQHTLKAVSEARDKSVETVEEQVKKMMEGISSRLVEFQDSIFGEDKNGNPRKKNAVIMASNKTYKDILVLARFLISNASTYRNLGKYKAFKKVVDELGVKLDSDKEGAFTLSMMGLSFKIDTSNETIKEKELLKVGINRKNLSKDTTLLCLVVPELRERLLRDKDHKYCEIEKCPRYRSYGRWFDELRQGYDNRGYTFSNLMDVDSSRGLKDSENIEMMIYRLRSRVVEHDSM